MTVREYGAERDDSYLYAAYLKGAFPDAVEKLTKAEFLDLFHDRADGLVAHLAVGQLPRGETPVGLFMAADHGSWFEPHVIWFPWSTRRLRMEAAAVYLATSAREKATVVFCRDRDKALFDHLARFSIVRWVGHIDGIYDTGAGHLYQARL